MSSESLPNDKKEMSELLNDYPPGKKENYVSEVRMKYQLLQQQPWFQVAT